MVVVTCLYHNYECINDVIVLLDNNITANNTGEVSMTAIQI